MLEPDSAKEGKGRKERGKEEREREREREGKREGERERLQRRSEDQVELHTEAAETEATPPKR